MIVKSLDQPKMQAILASLVEGVIIFDLDGRVIVANHVVERIFRTARGTMVGKTMEGISPNSDELWPWWTKPCQGKEALPRPHWVLIIKYTGFWYGLSR